MNRLWGLVDEYLAQVDKNIVPDSSSEMILRRKINDVIDSVDNSILPNYDFHLAIASLMKFSNDLSSCTIKSSLIYFEALQTLFLLLAPFAPHISSEMWSILVAKHSFIHDQEWPLPKKISNERTNVSLILNGQTLCSINIDSHLLSTNQSENLKKFIINLPEYKLTFG